MARGTAQQPPTEPLKTSITVTEKIAAETPASIAVLDKKEVEQTPGINLDERLRQVPGFSLFRRSSSLIAHPTTQGVSLRGIGSTGASRTLVLWDGIPINDPFGGWVYWTRVPVEEISRIEIIPGTSTSVFGDRAMGGVISLFSAEPQKLHVDGGYDGGNYNSHELFGGVSQLWNRWGASAHARAFTTDGFYIVPVENRGAIDRPANVKFVSADTRADWLGGADRFFLKFDMLEEERQNGTALQHNSTGLGTISGHYQRNWSDQGLALLAYHTREEFRSGFSRITADRNAEFPTFRQTVPAQGTGGAAMWNLNRRRFHALAGADATLNEGYSKDRLFPSGSRIGGGRLLQHGAFAQSDFALGPARLFAGLRHDFTGRGNTFLSPSAGLAVGKGRWRARGSVYRAFRAPTLNELFREFRAGNATTRANPELRPETLFGAEAGFDITGENSRASVTVYRNSLTDLITNVTLSATSSQIVRQRQNAAAALARGVEAQAIHRWGSVRAEARYLFVDSRYETGLRIPQVPKHQGSAEIAYERRGTLVAAGFRSYSYQFDDDLNLFLLPGFATVHFSARQQIRGPLSAIVQIDNLLDRQYLAGFSPTPTIGTPRLWRAGLRFQ